ASHRWSRCPDRLSTEPLVRLERGAPALAASSSPQAPRRPRPALRSYGGVPGGDRGGTAPHREVGAGLRAPRLPDPDGPGRAHGRAPRPARAPPALLPAPRTPRRPAPAPASPT